MTDHVQMSKTLSFWLRHKPEDGALALDAAGWTETDAILAALARKGFQADIDALLAVVESNDKQRFEMSADLARIRARQGHSVAVDLALAPAAPPEALFHGTPERFLAPILAQGLRKMKRHHVHLSPDVETARKVGARRGTPVILQIDARAMSEDGALFFVTDNGVWLTDHVPPARLTRL